MKEDCMNAVVDERPDFNILFECWEIFENFITYICCMLKFE